MRGSMPRILTCNAWVLVATLVFGGRAAGLEGELSPLTREKLQHRVTFHEGKVNMEGLLPAMVEETGLSVVTPLDIVHMPEPVAIAANDVTVEELIDALAFVLRLEVMVTPNGVIAFRLPEDDPRREVTLRRYRGPRWRKEEGGEGGRLPPEEVIERVSHHPEVRRLLDRIGGRLFFEKFHPEKRVWILAVRAGPDEPPRAIVYADEDGNFVGIKKVGREREKGEERRRQEKPRRGQKEHF